MRVAITGSTGFIGSALLVALKRAGHQPVRVVRSRPKSGEIYWDPAAGAIEADGLEGVDAVVHLSGENLAGGRWTPERRRRIRESRVVSTSLLAETLAQLARPPRVLVCASAVGYYGHRGSELLTEASPPGTGFLADLCVAWETAAGPAASAGVRVVHTRSGVVVHPRSPPLSMMVPLFRLGLGARLGSGDQYLSWVALDDALAVIQDALAQDDLRGPINVTAPEPVTNAAFTATLGRVLNRPTVLAVPEFALHLALGDVARETMLSSARVAPQRLTERGFRFTWPELEPALRAMLNRARLRRGS